MRKCILTAWLLLLLLTGCGTDHLADRVYTQAIALSGNQPLSLSLQSFDSCSCRTVPAGSIPDALAREEAAAGGKAY